MSAHLLRDALTELVDACSAVSMLADDSAAFERAERAMLDAKAALDSARATGRIGVVTRVAVPPSGGNLAMGAVYLDPQAKGGDYGDAHEPLHVALDAPVLALYVRVPVFTVGELLVLDSAERDPMGRKPSKWDIDVEWFDDLDEAVARAHEVAS